MVAGLLSITGTVWVYYYGEKSNFWPKTKGKIISSEVEKYERSNSGGRSITYKPAITYSYSLQNKTYSNDRVSFSPIGGSNISQSHYYVSRFSVGNVVPIFYDKNNPKNSTLIKGTSTLNKVAIFAGAVFLLFGLLVYKLRNVYANSIPR
jgi:hypothetical protein